MFSKVKQPAGLCLHKKTSRERDAAGEWTNHEETALNSDELIKKPLFEELLGASLIQAAPLSAPLVWLLVGKPLLNTERAHSHRCVFLCISQNPPPHMPQGETVT